MKSAILVRPLSPADVEAYRSLRLQGLRSHPEAFGASYHEELARDLETTAKRLEERADTCMFGAFADDELIGTAGFVIPDGSAKSRHKGLLVAVHVTAEHRGHAVGRALVEAVIAHARPRVVLLKAAVGADNLSARRLYDRLGFRQYGLEQKALRVDGVFIDEALLVLDLGTPPTDA